MFPFGCTSAITCLHAGGTGRWDRLNDVDDVADVAVGARLDSLIGGVEVRVARGQRQLLIRVLVTSGLLTPFTRRGAERIDTDLVGIATPREAARAALTAHFDHP